MLRIADDLSKPRPGVPAGFTLIEVLVSVAIIAILLGLLSVGVRRVRDQSRLRVCAANMRELGRGLFAYAAANDDVFPHNIITWEAASVATRWTHGPDDRNGWVGRLGVFLFGGETPWLFELRCPTSIVAGPQTRELGFNDTTEGGPGSSWMLNSYVQGRKATSIPLAPDGVLAFDMGVYDRAAWDTGSLALPQLPWAYAHPSVLLESTERRWVWLGSGRGSSRRNILWCDGHVADFEAGHWRNGDLPADEERIRHMRFGLPATNDEDR